MAEQETANASDHVAVPVPTVQELASRLAILEHEMDNIQGFVYDPWETGESLVDRMEELTDTVNGWNPDNIEEEEDDGEENEVE